MSADHQNSNPKDNPTMGISGRVAAAFQNNAITPLLAIVGLLLGFFAIAITPKEEEPQIDVTFANVFIAYPGASAKEVENLISTPAEQILSEIAGVDDIYSVSQPGMSTLTVAFKVGLKRETAILNLYNKIYSNADWLPPALGASQPLIKPMGIDDVPIMHCFHGGETPLMRAAADGNQQLLDFLLSRPETRVDSTNHRGETALELACFWGHPGAVKTLLKAGANTETYNQEGKRPGEDIEGVLPNTTEESLRAQEEIAMLLAQHRKARGLPL